MAPILGGEIILWTVAGCHQNCAPLLVDSGMSEKRLVTLKLRAGTLTAEVPPEETEDVLTALARWYGKYWIAYVKDDTGRLWSWAYGDSRKEAREGLSLDGLVEHLGTEQVSGETEVAYEVVLQPPRRTVVQ